jgi:PAS domain S-box-containing protein
LDATPFPVALVDLQDDRIFYWSSSALALFGHTAPTASEWYQIAYPDPDYRREVVGRWKPALEIARRQSPWAVNTGEYRVTCRDGSERICELYAAFIADYLIVTLSDITERKRAETTARESEQRFRSVANTAPVMIWMSGPDKLCDYFNQPWLDFTGRPLEKELGNGWAEGVDPEDLEICLETFTTSFDRREPFQIQYRLRRHDGEFRWIFDQAVPKFNADGSFAGYIGSCIDVTEHKLAKEALSNISRKLIEAQEQERTYVARELHDDVNQRVALLAIKLANLKEGLPASAVELSSRIGEACDLVLELGRSIEALSHRLHSSQLQYLGLEAAAASFCKELSDHTKMEIDFRSEGISEKLPEEVSLCLFRVLQEALQNAAKHSDARNVEVTLRRVWDQIHLMVRDRGIGFDTEDTINSRGIGLTSMRERLKLVDGVLSIQSRRPIGTTIHAFVRVNLKMKSASV